MAKPKSKIALIRAFHAFCVSKGTDHIQHSDAQGNASWNGCAFGLFAKSLGQRPSDYWGEMSKALWQYKAGEIATGLNRVPIAEREYPTFDKLAAALGQIKGVA